MHSALIEAGYAAQKIRRETFDAAFALYFGVTGDALRLHIAAGEDLGLWVRSDGGTRRGTLRILVPTDAPLVPTLTPPSAST